MEPRALKVGETAIERGSCVRSCAGKAPGSGPKHIAARGQGEYSLLWMSVGAGFGGAGSSSLGSRGRGLRQQCADPGSAFPRIHQSVIPANAGIQRLSCRSRQRHWIPAFAGMTFLRGGVGCRIRYASVFESGFRIPIRSHESQIQNPESPPQ
ncbi:hypothetical protein [Lysobacter gummosus]|uniref:hypothetical protein n=1 Tax=Lysobacter gummosus TaxID=262324 RepID=UPI00363EFFA4